MEIQCLQYKLKQMETNKKEEIDSENMEEMKYNRVLDDMEKKRTSENGEGEVSSNMRKKVETAQKR